MTEEIKINFEMLGGFGLLTTKIPSQMVTSLNQYIDMHVIEENNSMSDRLVGQLNRTEKSSQLEIDMTIGTGEMLKTFLDGLGTQYIGSQMGDPGGQASTVDLWSNDAYEGDYQPLHMHGSKTPAGLSGFLYLRVPPQIQKGPPGYQVNLKDASGDVDGYTQLVWGSTHTADILQLKPQSMTYLKPEVGTLFMFPNWLYHQVAPFFGEGCRRSVAFNLNIENSPEYLSRFNVKEVEVSADERWNAPLVPSFKE